MSGDTLQRILIVTKFRFIGDTLLAVPLFRAARAQWPQARIVLLTGKNARVLLQNNPYLDEIVEFAPNSEDVGLGPHLRLIRRLRRERFDLCLCLNRSFHSAAIAWLAGVKIRAGFVSERRALLLNRRVRYEYESDRSEAACYFDVLHAVAPGAPVSLETELWISAEEERQAWQRLHEALGQNSRAVRLIGLQPGATVPYKREQKRWPTERFAAVADALAGNDPDVRLVLLGGADEQNIAEEMRALVDSETRPKIVDFVGRLDLRGSLAVVAQMDLFIGNDTSIMHSAVALGIPTLALFGPTNPRKWGTYRDNYRVLESPTGLMEDITVTDVVEAAQSLLTASPEVAGRL